MTTNTGGGGYDRLGALDTSFLNLETLETPMHVGALGIFEGPPFFDVSGRFRLAAVRNLVASRLHLIPRFRTRLMTVPMDQGRPIWVDDDRLDISYHVRLTALPRPGTRRQLLDLTARIEAQLLDRSRPLWELWFVEGLEGNRVALIQKTHHALVDGVSGVDVATVLLDITPEPTIPDAPGWLPRPAPTKSKLLADTLVERSTEPTEIARTVRGLARAPQRALDQAGRVAGALRSLVDGTSVRAPRTSFNVDVGQRKVFTGVQVPFAVVQRVRDDHPGVTINDVVLAGVTGALRRRLLARGDDMPDALRALCPVSVRTDDEHLDLGNRISAMVVDLPVGEPDAAARLKMVNEITHTLKARDQAAGPAFLLDIGQYASPGVLGVLARLAHRQPFVNLVVTNVPGPPIALYCLGARLEEAYPMVPLSGNLTLGVAILSYCGNFGIGLWADADAWGDLDDLAADLDAAFAELGQAGGPDEHAARAGVT